MKNKQPIGKYEHEADHNIEDLCIFKAMPELPLWTSFPGAYE